MLTNKKPVGIVSVHGSLIENLYVLPSEQNKGYRTQLLAYAYRKNYFSKTVVHGGSH